MNASDDRGGKELLGALGFSLFRAGTQWGDIVEVWDTADKLNRVTITDRDANFFLATDDDDYPRFASAEELRAVLKRIEELRAGDAG